MAIRLPPYWDLDDSDKVGHVPSKGRANDENVPT